MSKPATNSSEMEPNINSIFFVEKSSRTSPAPVDPKAAELRRRMNDAQAKIEEQRLAAEEWDYV